MDARPFARYSSRPSYGEGIDSNYNSNLKKEICRRFRFTGCCNYGENCIFAHMNNDGMIVNSHGIRNMNLCHYFTRGMNCPYERCKYVHQKLQGFEEKGDMPRQTASISIQTVQNRDTVDSGINHHWKTRLCMKWNVDRKSCQYGDRCNYAHGLAELRRSNPALRTVSKNDAASNSGEPPATYDRKVPSKPKVCPFKWNGNKKIIGIYADWIDEDSLGAASSSKQQ